MHQSLQLLRFHCHGDKILYRIRAFPYIEKYDGIAVVEYTPMAVNISLSFMVTPHNFLMRNPPTPEVDDRPA